MRNAECGTGNGEGEMADDKCRMADGKCRTERTNHVSRIPESGWPFPLENADGGWRMANDATERPNQVSLVPESGWPLPQPWRRAPPAGREWSTVGWRRAG